MGVCEKTSIEFNTPIGMIKTPCTIEKVEIDDIGVRDYDFILHFNDVSIDISCAVIYALEDMDAQNQRAPEMEKKYNRQKGRYLVKDMSIAGVSIDKDWNFRIKYVWTDCYGNKRCYLGCICKVSELYGRYFLTANNPQFFF